MYVLVHMSIFLILICSGCATKLVQSCCKVFDNLYHWQESNLELEHRAESFITGSLLTMFETTA